MPVTLPSREPDLPAPRPPRMRLWGGALAIIMAIGTPAIFLSTPPPPHNAIVGKAWFWVKLAGGPMLIWLIFLGLRWHFYDTRKLWRDAELAARKTDYDEAVRFGQDPLAVVSFAYLTALGVSGVARKIVDGNTALKTRSPRSGGHGVRHAPLLEIGTNPTDRPGDRYGVVFGRLLDQVAEAIRHLPRRCPLAVHLQIPAEEDVNLWNEAWRAKGLRSAELSVLPETGGIEMLDAWLDIKGGPALERFALVVAVQLYDDPLPDSAEIAVALLVGWQPLAARHKVSQRALLHRPVGASSLADVPAAIHHALLWGGIPASQVAGLWHSGPVVQQERAGVIQEASKIGLGAIASEDLSGVADLNTALGDAGAVSGWLAIALAVEHAALVQKSQLIHHQCGGPQFAVIQPIKLTNDVERQG